MLEGKRESEKEREREREREREKTIVIKEPLCAFWKTKIVAQLRERVDGLGTPLPWTNDERA